MFGFVSGRRVTVVRAVAAAVVTALGAAMASSASAQAIVLPETDRRLPRPFQPVERSDAFTIESLTIEGRIRDRGADLTVSQTVRNDGSGTLPVRFLFPLPADAAVDGMTLLVDGEEMPAELLDADAAKERFREIVRQRNDPALLEWGGGGVFETAVFPIPAGESRTVSVHYTRLLPSDFGVTAVELPLSAATIAAAPVGSVSIRLAIESDAIEKDEVRSLYSPTHEVEIDRKDGSAVVTYEASDIVPDQDFALLYDTAAAGETAARLMTYRPDAGEDGYFLLLVTPPQPDRSEIVDKTTVMVVDRSGSMGGEKIEQARMATRQMVDSLRKGDRFNLVSYADEVETLFGDLQPADDAKRQEGRTYIDGIFSGGGTNIHDALVQTMKSLPQSGERPSYVLFLTDGQPTVGVVEEPQIAEAVAAVSGQTRLVCFGVGYDVNSRLLDRLSTAGGGFTEYVKPGEPIEAAVSKVVRRLSAPVLTDATLEVAFRSKKNGDMAKPTKNALNRVLPSGPIDLYAGQEFVLVGRYRTAGKADLTITGMRNGEEVSQTVRGRFEKKRGGSRFAFIEKLWATRRIGEIINQLDLEGRDSPAAKERIEELIALSRKHGILTAYTSFLADETDDTTLETAGLRLEQELEALDEEVGGYGVGQRAGKQLLFSNDRFAAPAASNAAQSDYLKSIADTQSAGGGYGGGPGNLATQSRGLGLPASPQAISPGRVAGELAKPTAKAAPTISVAGDATLYVRNGQLRTADTLDIDEEETDIMTVVPFSDAYFDLIAANTADENAILARQQPTQSLLVKLRDRVYLIAAQESDDASE